MSMTADQILSATRHRAYPLPQKPWVMRQEWHDLLFLHWRMEAGAVQALVPGTLELDLWDGDAYLTITPLVVRRLRPRGVPPLPGVSAFPEINVRTYVRFAGIPGVFFFSLDAANRSAVLGARILYALPYHLAAMRATAEPVHFASRRIVAPKPAEFSGSYGPVSGVVEWEPPHQSLERFLAERYCLYAYDGQGIYRTHIHHLPWPLQPATAAIEHNTMTEPLGMRLTEHPSLMHFSRSLDVLVWWPERVA